MVAPFDVQRLELTGAPLPLADELLAVGTSQAGPNPGNFAVSRTGRLVYRIGGSTGVVLAPVWVERDGLAREIHSRWRVQGDVTFSSLALSPDGTRLAISIPDPEGAIDLWVKQLDTGPMPRLTFEGTQNIRATWSPDGQSLTFVSNREGDYRLWTKRADGSGPMYDVSPDDQRFVMLRIDAEAEDTELILGENWAEELRQRGN